MNFLVLNLIIIIIKIIMYTLAKDIVGTDCKPTYEIEIKHNKCKMDESGSPLKYCTCKVKKYDKINLNENFTIQQFYDFLQENPYITLDTAILKFENADKIFQNLEQFAKTKMRKAKSYRKSFKKSWKIANNMINS